MAQNPALVQQNAAEGYFASQNPGSALMETNKGGLSATNANTGQTVNSTIGSAENAYNSAQAGINAANAQSGQISALLKSIQAEEQANVPGVAPALNLNAINAQAQQSAQNTVNPLYTQYMSQYLQQEAANQQAAQSQNTLNLQGEQAGLQNTLAQNKLAEQAAGSSNALQQGNINVQQQNYQLQSGNTENQKLQAIGSQVGSGNLGGSGLGQQQIWNAENTKNIADAAQAGQFQYERNTSNLSTQDTFSQLAQSSLYAGTQEGEAEAQTNFNLNDYLRQAAYNDTQYKEQLAASQQQAITAQTQQFQAAGIQQQLAQLNAPGSKNYAAGEQAYQNLLNPSVNLPSAPNQNDYLQAAGSAV